jgi:hypothetical protein
MRGNGNYPTRVANGLAALSDDAHPLYLRLLDLWQGWSNAKAENRCFLAALAYSEKCGAVIDHILRLGPINVPDSARAELLAFFAERWRHNFMEAA